MTDTTQQSTMLTSLPSGFEPATSSAKRRIIMTLQKREKNGGTHFALTAPGPIAYCNFDKASDEDVLPKFAGRKEIYAKNYWLDLEVLGARKEQVQEAAQQVIDAFEADFKALLQSPVRSLIIDTATELYQYKRLAAFGKLTQVMPHHYGPVNQWFRTLLDNVSSSDKNIILLERRKKEYINDAWSGDYARSGFSETPFLVQLNALIERAQVPDERGAYPFTMTVLDSSQNATIKGLQLRSDPSSVADWSALTGNDPVDRQLTAHDKCNFQWLGVSVFPNTTLKDWV